MVAFCWPTPTVLVPGIPLRRRSIADEATACAVLHAEPGVAMHRRPAVSLSRLIRCPSIAEPPRSPKQRMLAGDPYIADDPEIDADWRRCALLVREYNATSPAEPTRRATLLRELLGSVGSGTVIRSPLQCDYGYQTTIGERGFANWGLVLLDVGRITIGDDMQFGPNVQLLRATHPVQPGARRDKWEAAEAITIRGNVWLGGDASRAFCRVRTTSDEDPRHTGAAL